MTKYVQNYHYDASEQTDWPLASLVRLLSTPPHLYIYLCLYLHLYLDCIYFVNLYFDQGPYTYTAYTLSPSLSTFVSTSFCLSICLYLHLSVFPNLLLLLSLYSSNLCLCSISFFAKLSFSFVTRGRLHMWGYSTLTFHCLLLCILQLEGIGCARNLVDLP